MAEKFLNNSGLSHYDTKIKDYIDAKTVTPSGWGVAKTGVVALSSTTLQTVDITDLGFTSADDYEVMATMSDTVTTAYTPKVLNKTATSFQIRKSGSGTSIPCSYVVVGKGYGGGTSYRDLVVDSEMSDTSTNPVENKTLKAYIDEHGGGGGSIDSELSTTSENAVQNKAIAIAVNDLQFEIDNLGEPFRVKQWSSSTLNTTIPVCTSDIANASIGNMDFTIDDVEGADYQVVGMVAYEVFDAASGGNRINCWPVCQFTMNTQKTLRVRWMCGGTAQKTAKRISAWVLLKHR